MNSQHGKGVSQKSGGIRRRRSPGQGTGGTRSSSQAPRLPAASESAAALKDGRGCVLWALLRVSENRGEGGWPRLHFHTQLAQQPRNTAVLLLSLLPKTVLMQSALVPEGQERGHM